MPREWRPSDQVFTARVRALTARDGTRGVADFYGVSTATVRRWNAGGQPRGDATARSVARRGRVETGPALQLGGGRFSPERTVYNPDTVAFVRTVQERRRTQRAAAVRNATNPEERAMAEAMPGSVSTQEATDFDSRLGNLEYASLRGFDEGDFLDYFGYEDDWDAFRSSYSDQ